MMFQPIAKGGLALEIARNSPFDKSANTCPGLSLCGERSSFRDSGNSGSCFSFAALPTPCRADAPAKHLFLYIVWMRHPIAELSMGPSLPMSASSGSARSIARAKSMNGETASPPHFPHFPCSSRLFFCPRWVLVSVCTNLAHYPPPIPISPCIPQSYPLMHALFCSIQPSLELMNNIRRMGHAVQRYNTSIV